MIFGIKTYIVDRIHSMRLASPLYRIGQSIDPTSHRISCLFNWKQIHDYTHDSSKIIAKKSITALNRLTLIRLKWKLYEIYQFHTLIECTSCVTIDGIQQCTDNVTPSRNNIMRLHEIKRNHSQNHASIACKRRNWKIF